ncbi:hypothetical protein MANES_13G148900v8 [Manihot esculenta]|uniref:Uncharacterized protein n=2 Tax=Manihot esculenta TaxID=3983 RepID=A0ACB7GNI2_MANES|nr:hypothetical protein MANES_13G148900v8 [Manihot esculenta]
MKISCGCVALLVIALLCLPAVTPARHIGRPRTRHGHRHSSPKEVAMENPNFYREIRATKSRGPDTVQIAGSSLPDCSHACGSCSPCRLVMVDEDEVYWRSEKRNEELEWSYNSTHVISQLTQCFTTAMVGPRAWLAGLFNRSANKRPEKSLENFTPFQEKRLKKLQERLQTPFDETRPDHQEALRSLWDAAFPDVALTGLISEQWKEMGWQGANPSTDFRTYPVSFRRLLFKQGGERATWEYPFAVAGINVSFMLIQMLDLQSEKPKSLPGINFVKLLGEDETAFDVLFCSAFELMDAQWLAMHASYMEFNEVLKVTREQLERELSLEDVHRIKNLPAYNLLYQ